MEMVKNVRRRTNLITLVTLHFLFWAYFRLVELNPQHFIAKLNRAYFKFRLLRVFTP